MASFASFPPGPVARRDDSGATLCGDVASRANNGPDKSMLLNPPVSLPDPYCWMRDESRKSEEVLAHLEKENEYTGKITEHLAPLRETLYSEMLKFIQETDYTTPSKKGAFSYYTRTFEGQSYKRHCRAPFTSLATISSARWSGLAADAVLPGEETLLDENVLAAGKAYCSVGDLKPSPSHGLLCYTLDGTGDEKYEIKVIRATGGEVVDAMAGLADANSHVEWGRDDEDLFYTKLDEAHRPYQLYHHKIGSDPASDVMLLEEKNEELWMGISKSQDGKFLFVSVGSKESSEVRYLSLASPPTSANLHRVAPLRDKVLYDVEHREGLFYITTNVGNLSNFKLVTVPVKPDGQDDWADFAVGGTVPFDGGFSRPLDDVLPLQKHLVCFGRENGIPQLWVVGFGDDSTSHAASSIERLEFPESARDVSLLGNYDYDLDRITVCYESLITPPQSISVALNDANGARLPIKQRTVVGYDPSKYDCERREVLSRDGKTMIPLSLVWRKDSRKEEGAAQHLHLYGYGSYGICMECYFSSQRLPLLDRGIVYAIAHIRGGGEMGRQWYEMPNGAKYLCKKNTFNDFVDCATHLVEEKITAPELLSCEGRSAGGLLIGASINQRPDLFRAAILGVPFVDVVSTMVDATIPLTAAEWTEWGNPNDKRFHEYMLSYSPVNNVVRGGAYPAALLVGGLHDPRVQYWEPAKLAATIRHEAGSSLRGPVCLKIETSAGHFSASDRYKYLRELAFDWAFILEQLGLAK